MKRIVSTEFKRNSFYPTKIVAKFDDNTEEEVIQFFEDELSFSEEELIGLRLSEARELHFKKDQAYLTS